MFKKRRKIDELEEEIINLKGKVEILEGEQFVRSIVNNERKDTFVIENSTYMKNFSYHDNDKIYYTFKDIICYNYTLIHNVRTDEIFLQFRNRTYIINGHIRYISSQYINELVIMIDSVEPYFSDKKDKEE